jgi:uncharacterized transporter YbjL
MSKKIMAFVFLCLSLVIQAQETGTQAGPQMADTFREEGKIYVVITVIAIIFIALAGFLFYIERKLKKLESKMNGK